MKPSENSTWLAVEGWCTPEEGDALYDAAAALPKGALVVEIGTAYGRSAIALALSGAKVVTIDSDRERIIEAEKNASACGVRVRTILANAQRFGKDKVPPIAFLYIDGWHDAANVRADYAAWEGHLTPGGLVWFHDAYGAGWPDVQTLIDELVAQGALLFEGYVGTIAKLRKGAS